MAIDRLIQPEETENEQAHISENREASYNNELSLRPQNFKQYIGQKKLKQNLELAIQAAKNRSETIDHLLLYGPPGLGKTTMAGVVAKELGANFHITAGPAIERGGDLASLLTKLQPGDILFIDEIHRLSSAIEEVLYSAMEDFGLDIILGKGPSAKSLRIDLPKFTLIGATTKTGSLAAPLRDRFGHVHQLDFYQLEEISTILLQNAKLLSLSLDQEASVEIAKRSRLTPRVANRILKRVRDYAEVHGTPNVVDLETAKKALKMLEIDEYGLDSSDRRILKIIIDKFNGGPVGLDTLAHAASEERSTIEDYYEPYLMRLGLIERTPRGRITTPKASKLNLS
jgi:Holliday junction DNA helicase RuvB